MQGEPCQCDRVQVGAGQQSSLWALLGANAQTLPLPGDSAGWGRALSSWMLQDYLPDGARVEAPLRVEDRPGADQQVPVGLSPLMGRQVGGHVGLSRTIGVGSGDQPPLNFRPHPHAFGLSS